MSYKIIPLPAERENQEKKYASLKRNCTAVGIIAVVLGLLAVLLLLGMVITMVVCELKRDDALRPLLYLLTGCFGGGAFLCAALSFLLSRLSDRLYKTQTDFRERMEGESTFYAGDGTFCSFEESGIALYTESGEGVRRTVPYSDMRFFSVCTRHRPREKGEWSVVLEIPLKYVGKKGKFKQDDPPALVQTEAKERLYKCLEAHGLELIGELPQAEKPTKTAKYTVLKQFSFPDRRARKRNFMLMTLGGAMLVGGIPLAIFWNITAGALVSVLGAFILGRATLSFRTAKSVLGVYREGIFWDEKNRAECMFLKWGELTQVSFTEKDGFPLVKAETLYGSYHFPSSPEIEKYLRENFAEKVLK